MKKTFAQLGLPDRLVHALSKAGITEPFPVQAAAIPDVMAGRDVSGKAPTGSGKTLAFGLPVVARVDQAAKHRPRALILAPTRELAEQIKKELTPLGKAMGRHLLAVYGGVGYGHQKNTLRKGVDILVATPGRLEDLMQQKSVRLDDVDIVVIDEADRMADMGFLPAVRRILDKTSKNRQTLLFSATLDGDVAVLARDYQREPVRHEAGTVEPETIDARHHFWLVEHHDRVQHAAAVVRTTGKSIVFTRTRHGADRLARQLGKHGIGAVAMHGGRNQNQRNRALKEFSTGRAQALIATDVAARGIHIEAVESVVHFDPPADHKDYLHRSGRTARAGATGTVVSLVSGNQKRTVRRLQQDLALDVPFETPQPKSLLAGGHRMADPAPDGRARNTAEKRRKARDRRPRQDRDQNGAQTLYVTNLPWKTTEDDVHELFGRYGQVHSANIITDRRTGRSRGFGFVEMARPGARSAVDGLNGSRLGGRDLTVKVARPRPKRR